MQQLMSYLLWWRGTPRPLTGQDRTNWRMHSDGATLSRAAACTAPWPPLSIDGATTPRCCRERRATPRRHLGARPVPHKAPAASAFACNIRPCSVTPRDGELRRTSPRLPPPHSAAPPSFAHQMICQLSNVAFHILTELLFECEHPVILLISSVVLCWSIQEL